MLAEQEANADLRAHLKCAARPFRLAVAYHVRPRRDRQSFCIGYVRDIYLTEIQVHREAAQQAHERALALIQAQIADDELVGENLGKP